VVVLVVVLVVLVVVLLLLCDCVTIPGRVCGACATGVDFLVKTVKLDSKAVKLQIWDTAGQDRFRRCVVECGGVHNESRVCRGLCRHCRDWGCYGEHCVWVWVCPPSIVSSYYRGAHGIVMVYDCTEPSTVDNLASVWIHQVATYGRPGVPIIVVGNKADLVAVGAGSGDARPAAADFARAHNFHHITASARSGTGVSEAFVGLARMLMASGVMSGRLASKGGAGGGGAGGVTPGVPTRGSSVFDCCRTS